MDFESLKEQLKCSMTKDGNILPRYFHSLRVVEMALKLNEIHKLNLDIDKIKIAGLLHDCAKYLSESQSLSLIEKYEPALNRTLLEMVPAIIHAYAGKYYAMEQYHIDDEEILNAIYYHTVGRASMSPLEELIFLADYIEEGRTYPSCVKAREIAFADFHKGTFYAMQQTIEYLKNSGKIIEESLIKAYDYYKQYER